MRSRIILGSLLICGAAVGVLSPTLGAQKLFGVPDPAATPGNAHRVILWTSYEALVDLSDAQLEMWKSRGVDGFVMQTRYLDEMGGIENWTGDASDPLSSVPVEGADVHIRQRTLRDNRFVQRCHARGLSLYLGMYLSNYHNLSTPLKVWNDDAGWSGIVIPTVHGFAGAAKLLGADGIATDSEMYRSDDQTWNWNYPGVTQSEAAVRALARQRGREFMNAVVAGFPNVEIINYRLEIPGDWEEKVQQQVNHVVGIWDKSVFVDFWNGIVDTGGFSSIHFFDPIFYKSPQIGGAWDPALEYNINGVRATLAKRWDNWAFASQRFFLSPFAWIDPGPSPGSFDDARPVDYVEQQLRAFHKWGEGNMFGLYAQHLNDFDYTPYVPALQAASTPDPSPLSGARDLPGISRSSGAADARPGTTQFLATPSNAPLPRIEQVADGVHEPTDAAFSTDGRLFLAERAGAIRILRADGWLSPNVAPPLDDMSTEGGNGLLAVALDPQFERTHFIYVVYTAASRSRETVFRLVRFREVQDTLGERAVLLDAVPAAQSGAAASLRFGPDRKMYVAFDGGRNPGRIPSVGSYNGKILRLNADGTTPAEQPMGAPVYTYGFNVPLGLAWQSDTGAMWVTGRDGANVGGMRILGPNGATLNGRLEKTSSLMPQLADASKVAFYQGDLFPSLRGTLIVAGAIRHSIADIRFDPRDPARISGVDTLVTDAGAPVRALAISAEGGIYFCVNDRVLRLASDSQ